MQRVAPLTTGRLIDGLSARLSTAPPTDILGRMAEPRHSFGPFVLDTARGSLQRDGKSVAIGQRGLALLEALLEADGGIVTKADLMDRAWPGIVVEEGNLTVQIALLRKLLRPAAGHSRGSASAMGPRGRRSSACTS